MNQIGLPTYLRENGYEDVLIEFATQAQHASESLA